MFFYDPPQLHRIPTMAFKEPTTIAATNTKEPYGRTDGPYFVGLCSIVNVFLFRCRLFILETITYICIESFLSWQGHNRRCGYSDDDNESAENENVTRNALLLIISLERYNYAFSST